MIEVIVNDRLGKKVRIKCNPQDTIGDFKKLVAAQTGTRYFFVFKALMLSEQSWIIGIFNSRKIPFELKFDLLTSKNLRNICQEFCN